MNYAETVVLLIYSVVWCGMCLLIALQVRKDIRLARRRERNIREKGINGTLHVVARYSTRATYHDFLCIACLFLGAVLSLLIRYIDFTTPHEVDVLLRYGVTTLFVLALVPFYLRVRDRRRLAEEVERHAPELREGDFT